MNVIGFGGVGFGFFLDLIEHHQQLTRCNFITLANLQLKNSSSRLGSELDKVAGLQGADGVDTLGELSKLSGNGLYLRWRRLRCLAFAGTDRDQSGEGEQKSLRMTHGNRALTRIMQGSWGPDCEGLQASKQARQKTFDSAQLKR